MHIKRFFRLWLAGFIIFVCCFALISFVFALPAFVMEMLKLTGFLCGIIFIVWVSLVLSLVLAIAVNVSDKKIDGNEEEELK